MPAVSALLHRLNEIAKSIEKSQKALALLGLGSIGKEQERLDEYSDLDFFVIADSGFKHHLIQDLYWLKEIAPIGFHFLNSADGHKVLFEDGVYCEFAVFEPHELAHIPFAEGKVIWQKADFDASCCVPQKKAEPWKPTDIDWVVGEIVTCLYVGLQRFARGEKLIATRFIQHFAVDLLLQLSDKIQEPKSIFTDDFQFERRFEQRFPEIASFLPQMIAGYEQCPQAALAILAFTEKHFQVNDFIAQEIRNLAKKLMLHNI